MAMVEQLAQLVAHMCIHLHNLAVVVEVAVVAYVAIEGANCVQVHWPLKVPLVPAALLPLVPHFLVSRTRVLVLQMLVETLAEASEDRSAAMSKESLEER